MEPVFSCKSTAFRSGRTDPYYLCAYLNSRVGQSYLERIVRGHVQTGINLLDLKNIPILIPHQYVERQAADAVRQAYTRLSESKAWYREAETLLLKELGLADLDLSPGLFYERLYSESTVARRLDAEYFQPKYDRLVKLLEHTGGAARLGDTISYCQRGVQPVYDDEGEVLVINSEHVGKQRVELTGNRRTTRSFVERNRGRGRVKKYDVLLNSTGYITIGRAQTLLQDIDAIVDSHVTILRPRAGLDPVYLGLFLNSTAGFLQTERGWTGSSGQIELRLDVIRDFIIWVAPPKVQTEICEKIEAAAAARQESEHQLDLAKRVVEIAVYEGEAAALTFAEKARR